MKEFIKNNIAILAAFLLPVLLILGIVLNAHFSKVSVKTNYNFVYATCENGDYNYYDCDTYLRKRFAIVDNKLVLNELPKSNDVDKNPVETYSDSNVRFFLYNTMKNENEEVLIKGVQELSLNKFEESPDGVKVVRSYGDNPNFLLFNTRSREGYFLVKDKKGAELNIFKESTGYQIPSFRFLGWVITTQ